MEPVVSKTRARKTKDREKKAAKSPASDTSWRDNLAIRVGVGLAFWLATVLLMGADHLFRGPPKPVFLLYVGGKAALLLVCLFTSVLGLGLIRADLISRTTHTLLLACIALSSLLTAKLVIYTAGFNELISPAVTPFLIPLAMAPILATLLLDAAAGVAVGVWTTLAVCLIADADLSLLLSGLTASTVAAALVHRARRRTTVIRTGLLAGLAQTFCVLGVTAINALESDTLLVFKQAGACIAGGFGAAVLALLVMPILERVFHVTSDIHLLELSDLGHPLLQRLALEAPGTYHHSLVVANLAQAAADEIGANSLLVRVCAYFHDIGKLCKPEFFTENVRLEYNPHDKLPPSMSSLVITAHVKEGLSLAMLYKLPREVHNVIREHHGTSLVAYFHGKARAQMEFELLAGGHGTESGAKVDEWSYRYGGPKPASPESAIIALADPVEAASRSIEKVTHAHIRDLVDQIVNARIEDGQLDDSHLTLEELSRVKKAFVFTLMNMLHARTPYPKDENRDKPASRLPPGEPQEAAGADRLVSA